MNFKKHAEILLSIYKGEPCFDLVKFKQFLELFFPEDYNRYLPRAGRYTFDSAVDKFLCWEETDNPATYPELARTRPKRPIDLLRILNFSSFFRGLVPKGFVIAEFGSHKYELIPKEDAIRIDYPSIFPFDLDEIQAYIHKDDELNLLNVIADGVNYRMLAEEIETIEVININGDVSNIHVLPYSHVKTVTNIEGIVYESEASAFANGNVSAYRMVSGCTDYNNAIICKNDNPNLFNLCDLTRVFCEEQEPPIGINHDGTQFYFSLNDTSGAFPEGYIIDDSGLYRAKPQFILPYNSFSHPDYSDGSNFKFGVEVEKEDIEVLQSIEINSFISKADGWIKERDGSLGDDGYELVSPVYDLLDLSKFKNSLKNELLIDHISAGYTSNCGCHITISSSEMTALELYSGLKSFFPLLYSLYPSRCNVSYSKATCLFKGGDSPTKYSGIYIKNSELLEFRIFPAVIDAENLLWRVKLIQILLKNIGIGEMSILKMILDKRSELNIHIRTMYKKSGRADSKVLSLVTRFINNAKLYNHVVLDASILNNVKLKTRK